MPTELVVADVGCGTGFLARALARRAARVICIDTSAAMLDKARENLRDVPAALEFRPGAMEALPLKDGEVDAAFAHMVLHHLADVATGLREMARGVKPGGQVVCVDLLPHHESWMHDTMAGRASGWTRRRCTTISGRPGGRGAGDAGRRLRRRAPLRPQDQPAALPHARPPTGGSLDTPRSFPPWR